MIVNISAIIFALKVIFIATSSEVKQRRKIDKRHRHEAGEHKSGRRKHLSVTLLRPATFSCYKSTPLPFYVAGHGDIIYNLLLKKILSMETRH